MRMKTRKALNKGRVAKALLVCSFTVFLFLGTSMASASPPSIAGPCLCPLDCPGESHANTPPFCRGHPGGHGGPGGNSQAAHCMRNCMHNANDRKPDRS